MLNGKPTRCFVNVDQMPYHLRVLDCGHFSFIFISVCSFQDLLSESLGFPLISCVCYCLVWMKTGHVQGCVDFFMQFVKWISPQEAQFLFNDLVRDSGDGVRWV